MYIGFLLQKIYTTPNLIYLQAYIWVTIGMEPWLKKKNGKKCRSKLHFDVD